MNPVRLDVLAFVLVFLCAALVHFRVHAEGLECVKVTKTLTVCTRR